MRQREDINTILDSDSIDPERARELELSIDIRDFATSHLLLPDNGSYKQYVQTGQEAVTWNVVAAPEFSLKPRKWCFIVSGCVSYLGYFKIEDAERLAGKLRASGFDTTVSPAIAYSTLGWFDDPLLDTMFRYSDEQLAAFMFHELAHQQLYVRGDTAFNEAYASFVEETGVRLWLEHSGNTDRLPGWLKLERAGIELNELIRDIRKKLGELYSSDLPEVRMREEKSALLDGLNEAYRALVESRWDGHGYYDSTFSRPMNNARLALLNSYHGGACAFSQLYHAAQGDMARFHQLAKDKASLDTNQRDEWLQQSCITSDI